MMPPRSIFATPALSVWLMAGVMVMAQEAPKTDGEKPTPKAPVASQENAKAKPAETATSKPQTPPLAWPVVTEQAKRRAQTLSPDAQRKLQAAIQYSNAQLQKAFEGIVREDEAAKLSSGGAPAPFARFEPSQAVVKAPGANIPPRRGPPPEVVARYKNLSDAAKENLRKHFTENREKIMKMSPEERKTFMESAFKRIAEEDEARRKPAISPPANAPAPADNSTKPPPPAADPAKRE